MKSKNIFWGLFFLCAGAMIILGQFDYFEINVFRLIFTAFLIIIAVSSIFRRNWFLVVMPLVWAFWINKDILNIEQHIQFFPLMIAGAFASVGLSIIFKSDYSYRGNYSYHEHHNYKNRGERQESMSQDDDVVNCRSSCSSSSQYLHSNNLQKAKLSCSLGSLQVYFDHAIPCESGLDIEVHCELGSIELYIPRDWNVINNVSTTLGAAEEKYRYNNIDKNGPLVEIRGSVTLGSIEIIYI
ncbi:putative membrane protein [Breznakia sp. PF5-3]|uniref:LiaF transmembrane domain-containing protein n=1 Tax=unclassified Breznakia TaxID=2623764 RepID=UPI0024076D68|nr:MULTISPECIES: hypothetical protein [unclassified Breznakia]MDF9825763.1 putative membrane protein [Breznakia sp. PM6-1]MDF9835431.1 putative membrane protein [Breznakia sp. PF5-3]MDF9837663.1 putative membrane protein [Breznakia sp. PFB2-8]MDF9859527.1 putative membrane protein [Breznakia sp. PH5-24]